MESHYFRLLNIPSIGKSGSVSHPTRNAFRVIWLLWWTKTCVLDYHIKWVTIVKFFHWVVRHGIWMSLRNIWMVKCGGIITAFWFNQVNINDVHIIIKRWPRISFSCLAFRSISTCWHFRRTLSSILTHGTCSFSYRCWIENQFRNHR